MKKLSSSLIAAILLMANVSFAQTVNETIPKVMAAMANAKTMTYHFFAQERMDDGKYSKSDVEFKVIAHPLKIYADAHKPQSAQLFYNEAVSKDVKVKKGSKIYKTVFCNDVVLFHGPIKEQIPNQVFFPYTPMVYSRDIQGNFIGCIDYLIQLQDLWNVELSKLFHYSNSKMLIVNSDTTTRKYEDLVKAYSIESKKKRGFLQFDPKDVTVIDNSKIGRAHV